MTTFTPPNSATRRVMRLPETTKIVGVCDMTLRRWELAGTFPRRFKLNCDGGPYGAIAHDYDEVQAWIAERRASRDTEAAAA